MSNLGVLFGRIIVAASALFMHVYKLSCKYGQHGMMKTLAKGNIPKGIKNYARKPLLIFKSGSG